MWLVDFITEQQKEEKRKKEKEEPSHYYRKWSWTLLLQQLSAPQPLSYWWRIIRYHQRKMAPKAGPTGCSSVTSVPCPFASFLVPSHRFFFFFCPSCAGLRKRTDLKPVRSPFQALHFSTDLSTSLPLL